MNGPNVSVVMAAYNAEKTVAETVESILAQSFRDFEFIIVEDGSGDRTAEIIGRFSDARIRLLRNERNLGLAPSLQRGVQEARGRYIARTDADDTSHPERLARQVQFLDAHPEIGAAASSFNIMDEQSRIYDQRARRPEDEYLQRELLKWNLFCAGSVMMRHDLLGQIGGYDSRLLSAEDYDVILRLAEISRLAIMEEKLYSWRVRPDSITHSETAKQHQFAELVLRMAWQRRLRGRDEMDRRLDLRPEDPAARRLLAEHCVIWGREALRQRLFAGAARLFARALRLDPASPRLWAAVRRAPGSLLLRMRGATRA